MSGLGEESPLSARVRFLACEALHQLAWRLDGGYRECLGVLEPMPRTAANGDTVLSLRFEPDHLNAAVDELAHAIRQRQVACFYSAPPVEGAEASYSVCSQTLRLALRVTTTYSLQRMTFDYELSVYGRLSLPKPE